MKIGIYGDSFGESYSESKHFAWYNLLGKHIPNARIKSYARGGTSVFYSYKKFLETYHTFDLIIFLVSEPNRYTKPVTINGLDVYPHSLMQIEKMIHSEDTSKRDKIFLEGLKTYYVDIIDEDFNVFANELMLEKIEQLHKRVIFFPCFYNSFSTERAAKLGLSLKKHTMGHFVKKQSEAMKIDNIGFYEENRNTISCHFTEEYNLAVAEGFASKIKNDIWNFTKIDNIKIPYNKLHYYNKRFDIR